ncbi:nuclease [Granulicella sp. S190]|uniref:nuclease n=1 Tax=Granulicella sp. S190 TaxID=1747226 RepID=UPI00131DADA3|nr:nuclease [Granulicella sp. S190]
MVRRLILVFAIGCGGARAQQAIGSVGVQNANIAGALEVSNGRAILVGNTTVTARDRTAEIQLNRGGTVRVCATSGLHVTSGQGTSGSPPLTLALDRGAIEVQMPATTHDMVMTPDLRFTLHGDGPLDLQLRVTRNGDTCVENRGAQAPTLQIADQFGEATYELRPGQHVLFEHGSLKEVVDHETSSCGCPAEPAMTVADALLNGGKTETPDDASKNAKTAAELHPFPAAVSAGLAPVAIPQAPVGDLHEQVSATLASGDGADSLAPAAASDAKPAATSSATQSAPPPTPPPAEPQKRGFGHTLGRFFRKIFGGA